MASETVIRFCQGVLYCHNAFHGTCINVFPTPMFTKLPKAQHHSTQIMYAEFHTDRLNSAKFWGGGEDSFTPPRRVWLSLPPIFKKIVITSGVPRRGFGCSNTPNRNSEGPPKNRAKLNPIVKTVKNC